MLLLAPTRFAGQIILANVDGQYIHNIGHITRSGIREMQVFIYLRSDTTEIGLGWVRLG